MFLKSFNGNKKIIANIFRIQANNSIGFNWILIRFTDFMLAGKKLTEFTSLFSPYDFKKNDVIILRYSKMNEINKRNLSEWTKFGQVK